MGNIVKFEIMYLDRELVEVPFGKSFVTRGGFGTCALCGCITKWEDVILNKKMCSEECGAKLWALEFSDNPESLRKYNYEEYAESIQQEIESPCDASKDILIVVHNQLDYVKQCIESVEANTKDYTLHVWDNGSNEETRDYLSSKNIKLTVSAENLGFIIPNNRLFSESKSEYVILLNSDTIVSEGWDSAMIGYLKSHTDVGVVGYLGGILNKEGLGANAGYGKDIDYVMGWCMCFRRDTVEMLFDEENLKFAYCEDADFCLRLKEKGLSSYALHVPLVHHYGNKTANQVSKERDITRTFQDNHLYMQKRWAKILEHR